MSIRGPRRSWPGPSARPRLRSAPSRPGYRAVLSSSLHRQVALELAQTIQIVRGGEDVDVGERHAHPLTDGLVPRTTEQGVEPDDPPRPALEIRHRPIEHVDVPGVPPVADDDDDRAGSEELAAEALEEAAQARADLRPAGPVGDLPGHLVEGRAQVVLRHRLRD